MSVYLIVRTADDFVVKTSPDWQTAIDAVMHDRAEACFKDSLDASRCAELFRKRENLPSHIVLGDKP